MNTKRCPVISKDGTTLIPIRWKRAKKLVKEKKAVFVKVGYKDKDLLKNKLQTENKIYPNTDITKDNGFIVYLQLKYNPENVDLEKNRKEQPFVLGFDSGTHFNSLSVVSKTDNVNYQYMSRNSFKEYKQKISEKMKDRKSHREERKRRTKLYRRLRIKTKKKLSATMNAKVQEQFLWISRLCKYYPVSHIRYERYSYNMNYLTQEQKLTFTNLAIGFRKLKELINNVFPHIKIDSIKGKETKLIRENLHLYKNRNKGKLDFYSHCSDAFTLAYSKLSNSINNIKTNKINTSVRFIIPIVYFGKGRRCLRETISKNIKLLKSRGKVLKGGILININRYKEERKVWSKLDYNKNNHTSKDEREYHSQGKQLKQRRKINKLNGTKILTSSVKKTYKTNYIGSHRNMLCTSSKKDGRYIGFVRNYCDEF